MQQNVYAWLAHLLMRYVVRYLPFRKPRVEHIERFSSAVSNKTLVLVYSQTR